MRTFRRNLSTTLPKLKNRILSGIQPSGVPTLGNYLGAFKQFEELQHDKDVKNSTLFMIADLHSITNPIKKLSRAENKENIFGLVASFIACNIDIQSNKNTHIFQQSSVSGHTELMWLLSCVSTLGELNRMTQFKSKSSTQSSASLGLYSYPVLMAADVLLYKADTVPVGEDQIQHLELSRVLAQKMNKYLSKNIFPLPKPLQLNSGVSRVMSLDNPLVKMSKSSSSEKGKILLSDSADEINKKVKSAVTDSYPVIDETVLTTNDRKGILNLLQIYSSFKFPNDSNGLTKTLKETNNWDMKRFKPELSALLIEKICPIGNEIDHLLKDKVFLQDSINKGNKEAQQESSKTIKQCYELIGLL